MSTNNKEKRIINGILNIYKEAGWTSADVVAKLRGILHTKKIGHTGTLDPAAEGVLPVCIGNATKICDLITDWDKEYEAVLRLGITTDTLDMEGEILSEKAVDIIKGIPTERIAEVINSFLGNQLQVPPMYSALKQNGQRLYDLARQGIEVERKPRPISIKEITIKSIELPRVTFLVRCSKGTYIRSLCQDIGERLGVGGAMEHLTRTRVGIFELSSAIRISEVNPDTELIRVDEVFGDEPKLVLQDRFVPAVLNGNKVVAAQISTISVDVEKGIPECNYRVYDSKGHFYAIYTYVSREECFKPVKMFL